MTKSNTTIAPTRATLAAAVAAGLVASMLVAAPAQAATEAPASIVMEELGAQAADLEQGLEFIQSIPDAVLLSGDAALQEWIAVTHPELLRGPRADIVGCTGAIAWLIASTAIPVAKILKIKKLINALGGVAKAVRIFWGASFSWEKIKAVGGAAGALAAELIGITSVKQKCFS
ncbi:hypothetical protein [Curtobacterium aetherium]|uniref:Uncharacterized protein n=1 Tax=Curtobacterium aetherium TaxID=2841594 RepID=A0ACD1E3U9_9MICO|nr:hypothetical protein [Curtobacterium sp. L6-1]QWS33693.1 hypothetical protein KM842_00240 [Curtobacterium sp. L6-1]